MVGRFLSDDRLPGVGDTAAKVESRGGYYNRQGDFTQKLPYSY